MSEKEVDDATKSCQYEVDMILWHLSIEEQNSLLTNDINNDFHELYGIERGGAVLVRPDGHVYWRSVSSAL